MSLKMTSRDTTSSSAKAVGGSAPSESAGVERGRPLSARLVAVAILAAGWIGPAPSPADQIVTENGNFTDAKIVGMQDGWILFHTAHSRTNRIRPSDTKLIVLDRRGPFTDFNQAERLQSEGLAAKAVVRYQRALRLSESFWPDLVTCRIASACDRAGQLTEATRHWIRVVQGIGSGPAAAIRLMPNNIPEKRNARLLQSVRLLDQAIANDVEPDKNAVYELLRYRILHHVADKRSFPAARRVAKLALSESLRCPPAYELQLRAMTELYRTGFDRSDLEHLDRAILDAPEESVPGFLLLKGTLLLAMSKAPDELARAASTLMRVPIHMPQHPLAADSLFEAALALERLQRPNQAIVLLDECLSHDLVTDDMRQRAQAARQRLQTKAPNGGSP